MVHPELREGEVWFGNTSTRELKQSPITSRRLGDRAYDVSGELLSQDHYWPIFVLRAELEALKIPIPVQEYDVRFHSNTRLIKPNLRENNKYTCCDIGPR